MTQFETVIGGKYLMGPKIGSGSFGQVYLVNQMGTNDLFALKKEDEKSKHPTLQLQGKILKTLEGQPGFMKIYWQGTQNKSNLMVIDLLGPSLDDLHALCGRKFSLKTTIMLADQMVLVSIEFLHSKNFIHRDIKPENFLMGMKKQSHQVYLIDFGLSKRFRDQKSHQHIPYKQNKNLTGTARYASINSHLGIQQSRRDDLEAIGYVLLYFFSGFLPWQGLRANNKIEKYQKIMEKKMSLPVQVQCRGLPLEFSTYLNYCRSLKFNEKPDYNFLRKLFRGILEKEALQFNYDYDWCHFQCKKNYNNGKVTVEIDCKNKQENFDVKEDILQDQKEKQIPNEDFEQDEQNLIYDDADSRSQDDLGFEDGEENISDDDIQDKHEESKKNNFEIDLEQKKNKLLFDDDLIDN